MNPSFFFNYSVLPVRVVFGLGRLSELRHEAERLGARRVLVLASRPNSPPALRAVELLENLCAGLHPGAAPHVPYEAVATGIGATTSLQADLLVAIGGGSAVGLAKGIALETGLPIVAVPTTYAGSEMTHIWGISRDGRKETGRDPVVKPRAVIYDPELLVSLPPQLTLTSGINAMAHAVEALYAADGSPVTAWMAEEGVRSLAESLPAAVREPTDIEARTRSLYGAWLAAAVLDSCAMGLHHKLCHTLGGSFNLPHAETHTVVLPYVVAYNYEMAPRAMAALARALNCPPSAVAGVIQDLSHVLGGPVALRSLGFKEEDIELAAEIAVQNPYANPRPVNKEGVQNLLKQAYDGRRPRDETRNEVNKR